MASRDLELDLADKLELLGKNNIDYFLVTIDPGKNIDNANIWTQLKDEKSPENLLETILSFLANNYDPEALVGTLSAFCDELMDNEAENDPKIIALLEAELKKAKKKRKPPQNGDP